MHKFLHNANFSVLAFSENETFWITNTSQNTAHAQLIQFQYIWISIQLLSFNCVTNNQTNLFTVLCLSNNMIEDEDKISVRHSKFQFYQNLFYWNLLKIPTWVSKLHPDQWQGVLNSTGDGEDHMVVLHSTYTDKLTLFLGSTDSTFRKYHHHYTQVLFLGTGKKLQIKTR